MALVVPKHKWVRRVGWFITYWGAGVTVVVIAALVVRVIMTAAGLTTGSWPRD